MQWMVLILLCLLQGVAHAADDKPNVLLANVYQQQVDVAEYWVSEKLDGVRAYWDGEKLLSRNGNVFAAPAWFSEKFPPHPLDGELWSKRGDFAAILSTVSKQTADDAQWQKLAFYVFELPHAAGDFTQRLQQIERIVNQANSPYLRKVEQFSVANHTELLAMLKHYAQHGAEGLMLHKKTALYHGGRSDDLLKLKPYEDNEARLIAYKYGKGKYAQQIRGYIVQTQEGKIFTIASGLTEQLRQVPLPVDTIITYQFNGLSKKGIPRFARYLRVYQAP